MDFFWKQRLGFVMVAGITVALLGCGSPQAEFRPTVGFELAQQTSLARDLTDEQRENVATILEGLFGTPDTPHVPAVPEVDISQLLNKTSIHMAGGPVSVDQDGRARGLYRKHCAHCHGITGDGMGPTAEFLNPYPRDYRMGKFKFKSTETNSRPTTDDIKRIVEKGIPGTAMPSFRVLENAEKQALVQYVIYLSIRGELERMLITETLGGGEFGLEEEKLFLSMALKDTDAAAFQERSEWIQEKIAVIANNWLQAQSAEVPPPPENWGSAESVHLGRELFYGTRAGCVKCHGYIALGDGDNTFDETNLLVDDWTKENWPKGIDKAGRKQRSAAGILDQRLLRPRNLRQGVYRGGRRPVDLYWRLRNGIVGTPMPAAKELTSDEIWYLLDYVRSLPFESISQPHKQQRNLKRERM